MTQKLRKAVFPVAGLGTRLLPATKAIPKELLTVVDRPLIQYAVDEAREAGIEQMIFVTGRGKSALVVSAATLAALPDAAEPGHGPNSSPTQNVPSSIRAIDSTSKSAPVGQLPLRTHGIHRNLRTRRVGGGNFRPPAQLENGIGRDERRRGEHDDERAKSSTHGLVVSSLSPWGSDGIDEPTTFRDGSDGSDPWSRQHRKRR